MIIMICQDDANLLALAYATAMKSPYIFGDYYKLDALQNVALLPPYENLFIIADNIQHDETGKPLLGGQYDQFYVSAPTLYQHIKTILPKGYCGKIFINACEATYNNYHTFHFASTFKRRLQLSFPRTEIYACNGNNKDYIATPEHKRWILIS